MKGIISSLPGLKRGIAIVEVTALKKCLSEKKNNSTPAQMRLPVTVSQVVKVEIGKVPKRLSKEKQ